MLTGIRRQPIIHFAALIMLLTSACRPEPQTLFERLDPAHSRITFENTVIESPEINILTYEYTYNGGGVAAADFDNDGLCDLFFTGNAVSNRLYLNRGDLKFEDVTENAKVAGRASWKTGVTTVDINADGWLDLYVCYSGPDSTASLSNELYVNQGVGQAGVITFDERAKDYGLDAPGTYSTQATFFDYDRDGDLDMFLLNHGNHFYSPFINTHQLRNMRHPRFGNRLYRNDVVETGKPHFSEVSAHAGIHGGGINFGLGVSVSDINNDGWPDLFVTNDYEEQDFLYLNNGDGTFREVASRAFGHFSRNGMGTDIADFNNDGNADVVEVDMWPEDNYRQKLLKGPDDFNRYMLMVDSGFHHQQMRNALQMNSGVQRSDVPVFCEVAQLAGVSATDWSWAPLLADFDNDGLKDLFITNGYLRDFTSLDFLKYTVEEERRRAYEQGKDIPVYELVAKMSSTKTADYIFRNNGDLTFSNHTKTWGLDVPNLSFGAAYADLDNDGDLELVTNNTNEPATVWVNYSNAKEANNNYIRVRLKGPSNNPFAIGSKVEVAAGDAVQTMEVFPTRGFQSAVEPVAHFGLGRVTTIWSLRVTWPDGKATVLKDVAPNQMLEVAYTQAANEIPVDNPSGRGRFRDISETSGIAFTHRENAFIDFDHEPLIPLQLSRLGPALARSDVNGDGFDDFYVGGAQGQSGSLYLSDGAGRFSLARSQPWTADAAAEDVGATFFDADRDGDADLFVVSGGNEFPPGSLQLDDRLYINAGNGTFTEAPAGATVADHAAGSCVAAADYDQDGDVDLYIGGRVLPGSYPVTTPGAILKNESTEDKPRFVVATRDVNPALREPGMVTDAVWTDFNNDAWPDLIIVGEWMRVRLFENRKGILEEKIEGMPGESSGLWTRIVPFDLGGDGDMDYVLGNAGNNLPWKVSPAGPLTMYYGDFNQDNRIDPIICYSAGGKEFPVASRDEMFAQMNHLRKKFTTYSAYASATIDDILDEEERKRSRKLIVHTVRSSVLENLGNGAFRLTALPLMAQLSVINGAIADDLNADGRVDLLVAGNFFPWRTQFGRSDASIGLLLAGADQGQWSPVPSSVSGFFADGDVRNMVLLRGKEDRRFILIARNNDTMSLIDFH